MNIASKTTNGILYISFNQDSSCISVSTRSGYSIYTCDPFSKVYGKQLPAISLARMLFCTSLVALVGAGEHPSYSPRRLQIVNTKRQSTICDLTFTTSVIGVELNRKRLVVVLEEHLYIYDIANMKLLHTIDTTPNPNSLCCLAASPDNCYLAYPSNTSSNSGELMIFDAVKLQSVNIISAHKSQLACITFNHEGTLLATSSDKVRVIKKGTVIRVFSCPDGKLLGQFRRGMNSARIRSLAFSMDSTYLCLSSDSDTIHIYKLDNSSNSDSQSPTLTQQPSQNIVRQNSTGGMLSSLYFNTNQIVAAFWRCYSGRQHAAVENDKYLGAYAPFCFCQTPQYFQLKLF